MELDGAYTSISGYPHEDLQDILIAASRERGKGKADMFPWISENAMLRFAEEHPSLFDNYDHSAQLIMDCNDIIHPEVKKIHCGGDVPGFDWLKYEGGSLRMAYTSERKLCELGKGPIIGTADYYGDEVSMEQVKCIIRSGSPSIYEIEFN